MHAEDKNIELRIDYSQDFSYSVLLTNAERIKSMGYTQWTFTISCVVRHPTGKFTYEANDIYFEASELESFDSQLDAMRAGRGERAELADPGPMVSFELHLEGRRLKSSIRIRESQFPDELTTLSASFEVDYDLFVNKLSEQMKQFIKSLRQVIPESV